MALTADSSTQLGCGRDIDQVWDHLDRAPDTHELTCPYCRAARADLAGLAQATAQLRDADATDPELQPSPAVLDRVLAVARSEVRRGRLLPLDQSDPDGTTPNTISEQALTAVVRRIGDRTSLLQTRRCTITTNTAEDPIRADRDVSWRRAGEPRPALVEVSLRVSAAHDLPLVQATSELRAAVIAAVEQEVGIIVTGVDITVEDLHDA